MNDKIIVLVIVAWFLMLFMCIDNINTLQHNQQQILGGLYGNEHNIGWINIHTQEIQDLKKYPEYTWQKDALIDELFEGSWGCNSQMLTYECIKDDRGVYVQTDGEYMSVGQAFVLKDWNCTPIDLPCNYYFWSKQE